MRSKSVLPGGFSHVVICLKSLAMTLMTSFKYKVGKSKISWQGILKLGLSSQVNL